MTHIAIAGALDGRAVETLAAVSVREREHVKPRQVDDKDAAVIGQVARIDPAIVGFGAPTAEGEAQTEPGSIRASLLERPK